MRPDMAPRSPGCWVDHRHPHNPPNPPTTHDHDHPKQRFWWVERRGSICDLESCSHRTKPIAGRNMMGEGRHDLKHRVLVPVEAPNAALDRGRGDGSVVRWSRVRLAPNARCAQSAGLIVTMGRRQDRKRPGAVRGARMVADEPEYHLSRGAECR